MEETEMYAWPIASSGPQLTFCSAVPAKDQDTAPPEEHAGIKRRASNSPEAEDIKKRARVEGTQSPKREDHSPTHPERRASIADDHHETKRPAVSKEEEKKRGKRLFGGLLNTLSQKTSTTQQKKRREIEQRQQEKAQKQKVEDDKRLAERLARLNRERRHDQIDFDEKVVRRDAAIALEEVRLLTPEQMKTRHANLIARAHSLYTKAEPRIVRLASGSLLGSAADETVVLQAVEAYGSPRRHPRRPDRRSESNGSKGSCTTRAPERRAWTAPRPRP
jgi:hypothetical protein